MKRLSTFLLTTLLGLTLATVGCGEDDPPPQDTGAEDAADTTEGDVADTSDAEDGGATDTADDTGDVTDAIDTADAVESCLFQGNDQGVCTEGTQIAEGADAGDATVSGDGGDLCRAPDNYVADEAPPEEEDPPYDICDDLDNDCDGVADEGCSCDFLGRSEGVCSQGSISSEDGSCEPHEDYQTDETKCDNVDNDCDGVKDEGCRCLFQGGEQETGVCEQGTISAENGDCEAPEDFVGEETDNEYCDAKDNDCDGEADEQDACSCTPTPAEEESCYTGPSGTAGTGICEAGTRTCQNDGTWGECANETTPESSESCDDKDNNCNGVTDEGCACNYTGTSDGVCSNGQIGSKGNCKKPSNYEQDETSCDGADNDCDGVTDEGCPCAYDGSNVGVCGDAKIDPSSGNCAEPDDYESTESSCDSKDNDCDGDVDGNDSDADCSCTQGDTQSCYTGPSGTQGTGQCAAGTQTCQSDGTWDTCSGETTPSPESCDGDDNDCDGAVDEGCSCNYDMNSDGVCENQTRNSSGDCPEPTAYEDPEATCDDNLDNDCDADTDCADSDCDGEACGSGSGATCQNNSCVEQQCTDGNDNDLDGDTDCQDSACSPCGPAQTCCPDGSCSTTGC